MKTVAVIEDDEVLAVSLQQIFEKEGYAAVCFPDPPSVEELATVHPDLVVLDCILTTTSGPDYLKQLQGHPDLSHVPVIVTTGYDELFESLSELESERVAVLRKPLNGPKLRETADRLASG